MDVDVQEKNMSIVECINILYGVASNFKNAVFISLLKDYLLSC